MIEVREYVAVDGSSPYARWFDSLNAQAAAKVTIAVIRIAQGNLSNAKSVGGGLQEYRIDFGPVIEFTLVGTCDRLVILLGGGTKKRQQDDIRRAHTLWADYKRRKKEEN
ncbi:MAG: type II toxin-antitoxin system RelE/ParE family toxin [Alphaproteobacteria bacterium]